MPILDFGEIALAHSGTDRDQFELFARDFLKAEGFVIVTRPDRGPDAGRDLVVKELRSGPGGQTEVRWLVSCKHKVQSGNAVSHMDETNIRDRLETHGCNGFIAFYSTLPSSSLSTHLEALRPKYDLVVLDKEAIEQKLLDSPEGRALAVRYMPLSFQRWVQAAQKTVTQLIVDMKISPRGKLNGLSFDDNKYLPDSNFTFTFSFHASCTGSSIKLLGFSINYYANGLICAGGSPSLKVDGIATEISNDDDHLSRPILIENGSNLIYSRKKCYPPLAGDIAGECDCGDIRVFYSYIADGLIQPVECVSSFELQRNGQLREIDQIRDVPSLTDAYLSRAVEEGRIGREKAVILLQYPSVARYRAARSKNSSPDFAGVSDTHRAWLQALYRGDSV
ncbi:hypothetical protein P3T23_006491 [Paraburkholderia sp. GAS448]|uniref:restriction endonuclease n=1 Tax=Paraburkholderia sp. GAS448 TaxID=3035136 RepID=UPI003D2477FA